jgi:hypothetical protein
MGDAKGNEEMRLSNLLNRHGIKTPTPCWSDCPEGWLPLADRLIIDLVALGWDMDLHQIKEKYGGLRFYIGDRSNDIDDRITQAEIESMHTCQICGNLGELRTEGWYSTLCAKHAK